MHFKGFVTSQPNADRYILWLKYLVISYCPLSIITSTHCLFSSLKWKMFLFAQQVLWYNSHHSFVRGFYFQRLNISYNVFYKLGLISRKSRINCSKSIWNATSSSRWSKSVKTLHLLIELSGPHRSGATNFWSFSSTKLIYGALKL